MRLPDYTGPFRVTCIDLEIPAREPRYFASGVVGPELLNGRVKPKSKGKDRNKGKNQRAKVKITNKNDITHSKDAQVGTENADGTKEEADDGRKKKDGQDHEFDPFNSKKSTSTLHFDTVLFTIYAPSSVTKEQAKQYSKAAWVGRPKSNGIAALFKYVGQYGPAAIPASPALFTLANASIPALVCAPLADPSDERARLSPPIGREDIGNKGSEPPQFPVVIFSHGLAGNRLSYSQFCGELASHGIIVAALEHRDGSGISSVVRHREREEKNQPENQNKDDNRPTKAAVPYLVFEKIGMRSFAPDATEEEFGLRQAQLEMRKAEILECKHVMERIAAGEGSEVALQSTRKLGSKLAEKKRKLDAKSTQNLSSYPEELATWKGKLDLSFPMLVGHSFGGATTFQVQRGDSPFPIAMALDPWVEPLLTKMERTERSNGSSNRKDPKDPKEVGTVDLELKNNEQDEMEHQALQTRGIQAPLYVFNSEGFTVWLKHFEKLKTLCAEARDANKEKRGWLMTLTASHHLDFSDYPFLLPHVFRSTVGPQHTIKIFSRAAYVQFGLARQNFRERENLPGAKVEADGQIVSEDLLSNIPQESKTEGGSGQGVIRRDTAFENSLIQEPKDFNQDQEQKQLEIQSGGTKAPLFRRKRTIERHQALAREQKEREAAGYKGVVADRTVSGSALVGRRRNTDDAIVFGEHAEDVLADPDAEEVHRQMQDISDSLNYKKHKVHSLLSLVFRLRGVKPGLDRPGKVLIHQY